MHAEQSGASNREQRKAAFRRAIETIKARLPIEDIVRERLPMLQKRGSRWVACCPFHEERTPSFAVDPEKGTWRCFGACHVGGDLITFVQRDRRLDLMTALDLLATRAGVTLPPRMT